MANLINLIALLITLIVFVYIISTWVFPPFHAFRQTMASLVEPMLQPIRRVVPPVEMFDFSAFILIVLIQVLAAILIGLVH